MNKFEKSLMRVLNSCWSETIRCVGVAKTSTDSGQRELILEIILDDPIEGGVLKSLADNLKELTHHQITLRVYFLQSDTHSTNYK